MTGRSISARDDGAKHHAFFREGIVGQQSFIRHEIQGLLAIDTGQQRANGSSLLSQPGQIFLHGIGLHLTLALGGLLADPLLTLLQLCPVLVHFIQPVQDPESQRWRNTLPVFPTLNEGS